MNQEPRFDVEGPLEVAELSALPNLLWLEEIDDGHQNLHNVIPEVEHEAQLEARPANQPGLLDVVHQQQPRAALESELRAFQVGDIRTFGRLGGDQETQGIYPSSDDDDDSEPGDINMHLLVKLPPELAADNMHHNDDHESQSDDQDFASDEDTEDNQDRELGNVNMHQANSLEPAANNMDLNSESADDIIMTDQNPEPAGDNNTVHKDSEPARDIDIDHDSEPGDDMMSDLDSDTDTVTLAESRSTVLQMHDLLVADASELSKKTGKTQKSEETFTVAPSPLPSSKLQPSSSTIHICESSLEPNLITTFRSTGSLD